ncbi:MAG: thiamine-phosphate kinase [Thioalkalispiraceae bacterium]|jgi:thiamine-monophosphate kinase
MPSEFDIIEQYFSRHYADNQAVKLGVGDDAAITTLPSGMDQVIAIDTLVEDVHFQRNTAAYLVAWKALAVNLSDLAAMGATPAWFTLALTLPEVNEDWLTGFSQGLFDLAERFKINLVGGDTTRGPLTISVQVAGFIARDKALLRSGARPGDHIFVTGYIGDGRAGLAVQQAGAGDSEDNYLLQRLQQPEPRIGFGQSLIGVANACIDVSDGLLADVAHILEASNVGASIDLDKMPLSEACQHKYESLGLSRLQLAQGGDDYELCFTVPEQNLAMLSCNCDEQGINITRIGTIEAEKGLRCYQDKQPMTLGQTGYQHF